MCKLFASFSITPARPRVCNVFVLCRAFPSSVDLYLGCTEDEDIPFKPPIDVTSAHRHECEKTRTGRPHRILGSRSVPLRYSCLPALIMQLLASTCSSTMSGISNYNVVANIRSTLLEIGPIRSFRAYGKFSAYTTRSELSSSGVTLIDFPDDSQKSAGVKTMLGESFSLGWCVLAG